MRGKISINNPKEIFVTMELTMQLGEWQRLQTQLDSSWPSWQLSQMIDLLLGKATKQFTEDCEEVK